MAAVNRSSIACLGLALACASKPADESVASDPVAEPVLFVEASPAPERASGTESSEATGSTEQDRERAKQLYQSGVEHFEAGDLASALEQFEQAYQLAPLPALRFNIARTREQLGDTAGACATHAELLADPQADDRLREAALQAITRLGC